MQNHPENMEKVDLYLSLGSNQGDRAGNIEKALSLLNIELKTPYKALSSLIETEPWGFESDEKFINAAVLTAVASVIVTVLRVLGI
jgi:2-amino-4-hydroxy-6-hydroxymethyldihydropteridine diphosphokinase